MLINKSQQCRNCGAKFIKLSFLTNLHFKVLGKFFQRNLVQTKKNVITCKFDLLVLFSWPDNTFDMLNVLNVSFFAVKRFLPSNLSEDFLCFH